MKIIGNKIECYRGESFILQISLVRKDGVPFYVQENVQNPYLCLTIKSNKYPLNGRYCKRYWLDIHNVSRVDKVMQAQQYINVYPQIYYNDKEYSVAHPGYLINSNFDMMRVWIDKPTTFAEFTPNVDVTSLQTSDSNEFPKICDSADFEYEYPISSKKRLYYLITDNGREYYYWKGDTISKESGYVPYTFLYKKQFLNSDTKDWISQQYSYEISYVAGVKMTDWLTSIYTSFYGKDNVPTSNKELAHWICKRNTKILNNVDITDPIVNYTINEVLIGPSKLIVKEK